MKQQGKPHTSGEVGQNRRFLDVFGSFSEGNPHSFLRVLGFCVSMDPLSFFSFPRMFWSFNAPGAILGILWMVLS